MVKVNVTCFAATGAGAAAADFHIFQHQSFVTFEQKKQNDKTRENVLSLLLRTATYSPLVFYL